MFEKIDEDIKSFLLKIIAPAMITVSIRLAVIAQKSKLSLINVVTSFIIGVGIASLCGGWIMETVPRNHVPIYIALITLGGENIAQWFIFKFKADQIAAAILENLISKLKK